MKNFLRDDCLFFFEKKPNQQSVHDLERNLPKFQCKQENFFCRFVILYETRIHLYIAENNYNRVFCCIISSLEQRNKKKTAHIGKKYI